MSELSLNISIFASNSNKKGLDLTVFSRRFLKSERLLGIYILMLNARYTDVIGRIREIYHETKIADKLSNPHQEELSLVIHRARILKRSMGLLVLSTVLSSFLVLLSIINAVLRIDVFLLSASLLPIVAILIMGSMILLFYDIKKSLVATMIHIQSPRVDLGRERE